MPASPIPDRYQPFRTIARDLGLDAVALVPGANFTRLFGVSFHTSERPLLAVIPLEGKPAAIVPNLELDSFAKIGFEGAVFDWRDQTGYAAAFAALAAHLPVNGLGVEGQGMRVFVHNALVQASRGLRIIDAEKAISGLRICKNDDEIAALERAIAISEQALCATLAEVRVGMSEKEIEARLVGHMFSGGAEELSFGPIVAAGDNSAMPHAHARGDYRIRADDALLFDFGARWGGMNADITRTVFVGEVGDTQRRVYETVLQANMAAHSASRPGATAHDVDEAATAVLEASEFSDRIRHKTGHGLGREVHEDPYIMRGNHQQLEPGMVFTIEPGLYKTGAFGVRIEDDVVVTATGCRSLTKFAKDLRVVG